MKTPVNKTILMLALTSITSLSTAHADEASSTFVLPGALHLEGVGTLYGAAAGIKDIDESDYNLYIGIAGGDANAFGLAVTDVALLNGRFSYIYAQADDAVKETQYQRGGDAGNVYEQDLSGNIHHFSLSHELPITNLTSTIAVSLSSVSQEGYADEDGNKIAINPSGLHDIDALSMSAELAWDNLTSDNRTGLSGLETGSKLSASIKLDSGRTAQSDQGTFDYQVSHHIGIGNTALASFYLNGSHAFIVKQAKKYDSDAEVKNALDAQCTRLTDANEQIRCLQLEQDLTTYITASNNKGTAKAVGGSQGLRSYQESFFRGSNSIVEGMELQWQLPEFMQPGNTIALQWITFAEGAQIADDFSELSENSRYSIGTGLRAYIGDVPTRVEFAHGEDGNAFLLTAGTVF